MKRTINVEALITRNKTFENNAPFRSCISKINNTFIGNTEDLDIVMAIYNLLEYSDNYSMKSGTLWNYYRDEMNYPANEDPANYRLNNNRTTARKSFEHNTKLIGRTEANNNAVNTKMVTTRDSFDNYYMPLVKIINWQ